VSKAPRGVSRKALDKIDPSDDAGLTSPHEGVRADF
jgi:hypothetical protein